MEYINLFEIFAAFVFLIAIIDPLGSIPITVAMENKGVKIKPLLVCGASLGILLVFLFGGDLLLKLFDIKIEYFAIAGGFIVLLMSLEMILDVTYFKMDNVGGGTGNNIVPLAFPLYAGPGTFTALISLTAEYHTINLVLAVVVSMVVLYIVLKCTSWLSKHLGNTAMYIIRKFFGILVLAIAVKLIFGNLVTIFN